MNFAGIDFPALNAAEDGPQPVKMQMEDKKLRLEDKRMGINVVLDGQLYHFDDEDLLRYLLDREADRVGSTSRENAVLYDDELY